MRGFGLTGQDTYLNAAQEELTALDTALGKGERLATSSSHLASLQDQLLTLTKTAQNYHQLVTQSVETNNQAKDIRSRMDQAAAAFNQTAEQFIGGQYTSFDNDLGDRLKKLDAAKKLSVIRESARVANFKAQNSARSNELIEAAAVLDQLQPEIAAISQIVRDQEDIDLINEIQRQASMYQQSIIDFSRADETNRPAIIKRMDQAAAAFVNHTTTFSTGQRVKLEKDIAERKTKIRLAGDIRNQVNQARIIAFKAKADSEPQLLITASETISAIKQTALSQLRPITRLDVDIARLDAIEQTAQTYIEALGAVYDVTLAMASSISNATLPAVK